MGREEGATQLSISIKAKNRLDVFKAENKEIIIAKYKKNRRMVTNTDAIEYLLDTRGNK